NIQHSTFNIQHSTFNIQQGKKLVTGMDVNIDDEIGDDE
ncbi:regulator PrlF, partial [Shigella sonnei]|nr:regulator PrlF [Shigella sonnei]